MTSGSGPGSTFEAGTRLGRYRLVAPLGTGGMAEVFLARIEGPAGFTKPVAIKRMRPELTANREFVDLFVEEARTAAILSHPNICHILELTSIDGEYFMVMEYLEGVPLSTIMLRALREPRLFDLRFFVSALEQACEGLHHAHEMVDESGQPLQIIHRDVSPPNLFVTTEGVVKLLDFGISKSRHSAVKTLTGQIRGKFSYMSPEQIRGEKLDRRSDIFSAGIVLFELVTGRRLFRRKSRLGVVQAIIKDPIPSARLYRSDLPDELVAAIDRALDRDRTKRFATARELADTLSRAAGVLGAPISSTEVNQLLCQHFAAELESKRMLLADLPGPAPPPAAPQVTTTTTTATTPDSDVLDAGTATESLVTRDTQVDVKPAPPSPDGLDDDDL